MASHRIVFHLSRLSTSVNCRTITRQLFTLNSATCQKLNGRDTSPVILQYAQSNELIGQHRSKHSVTSKYSRGKDKSTAEDEEDDDDRTNNLGLDPSLMADVDGKDVKIIKSKLNSMRLDSLLKAGLGTAKHKVEEAFYESRIRVNGEKILKKSKRMEVGDEIDLIKGPNALNPDFLDVSRVIVIAADYQADLERVAAILKRYKSLTIENYKHAPYRGGTHSD